LLVVAVLIGHASQPTLTGISSFCLKLAKKITLVEGLVLALWTGYGLVLLGTILSRPKSESHDLPPRLPN